MFETLNIITINQNNSLMNWWTDFICTKKVDNIVRDE